MVEPKFKVAVQRPATGSIFGKNAYEMEREALDPIGASIIEVEASTVDEFINSSRDADAVIGHNRRITREIIAALEKCKVIGLGSVGADTVDVDAATEYGIVVTNVPDIFIEEVADHTMAMFLAAFRRLPEMHRMTVEGEWAKGRELLSSFPRLWGQTMGLVSFGNVAKAVARRCHAFGLRVIAYDPYLSELEMSSVGVEPEPSLIRLLQRSDFVSMHAPLNEETRHMLTNQHFSAMKKSAIFINNGRGPTVDESALITALENAEIAAAALDVFEEEPITADSNNPLVKMSNVICSPHVASASDRMRPEALRRMGREIATVLTGRWPRSAVNPGVLPKTDLARWQPYPQTRGPNR